MKALDPLWIALSTYSILPAPRAEWTEENMRSSLCFLPVVGVLIGGALLLWQRLCLTLEAPAALFSAVAVLLPLLLSGGIHMDGFMDTLDALCSRQPIARKLQIMKDPNTGAFAVMGCAGYLLISFGVYWALYEGQALRVVSIGFILSRSLCALSALTLPSARGEGMLHAFTHHAVTRRAIAVLCALWLLCTVGMALLSPLPGLCGAAAAALAFFGYRRMVKRQFGGATGDTCGYFLQLCELCILFGVWIGGNLL